MGIAKSIIVAENLRPAIKAKTLIKNPYTDFPLDPDITFGDGYAKKSKGINPPAINILILEEKSENVLTPMIKRRRNITKEYDSTSPGEPPTHLTEFIHNNIQAINIKSPGNTKDIGIESILVLHVYAVRFKRSSEKKLIFAKSITEKAIILAATI